ncbi:Transcription elongation factor A protein 1, variant 2 [Umbelopsis sp. WA50703]
MPSDKIRSKSAELLAHALIGNDGDDATIKDKCTRLASETEQQIFVHHGEEINNDYKEAIRSHVLNLKDTKNNLRSRLLSDQLNATTFADMVSTSV